MGCLRPRQPSPVGSKKSSAREHPTIAAPTRSIVQWSKFPVNAVREGGGGVDDYAAKSPLEQKPAEISRSRPRHCSDILHRTVVKSREYY